MSTIRLTAAQALGRFLTAQRGELDCCSATFGRT
jgi:TPP-dependent trihydroxycyclohexane-1,2-dione (THcHDO) dehydratase